MPKANLKIQKDEFPQFQQAAKFSEVNFDELESVKMGSRMMLEVSVKNVSQLFECGQVFEQLRTDATEAKTSKKVS